VSFMPAPARLRSRAAIGLALALVVLAPSAALAAKHLGQRTLHRGDRGHDVRVLQDFLTQAGLRTPIAGVFGPQTLRNVRRFQRTRHLTIDGVVGPQVVHALRGVVARRAAHARSGGARPAKHLGDRTLKKGMRGQDVRVLQDYLGRAGLTTAIDGVFGPGTLHNVRRFQRTHRLAVDGVVGPQVVGALRHVGDGAAARRTGPVGRARLRGDGTAVAPVDAPRSVRAVIAAGNRIATKPYVYGGGHGRWNDRGYDCSGSVSYALHGGGLLASALPSGSLMSWGARGAGRWITIYTNPGHAFMVVAGLRFDTSGASPSRWQADMRSTGGYVVRHPSGL